MVDVIIEFIMIVAMASAIHRMVKDWNKTFDITIIAICIIALLKI